MVLNFAFCCPNRYIGISYANGSGVDKNEIEAAKYYTLAADQAPWVHSIV